MLERSTTIPRLPPPSARIPLLIHQMWLDKEVGNNQRAPEKYYKLGYIQSWKEKNPHMNYILWNKDMVQKLLSEDEELRPFIPFYNSSALRLIEQCDFARMCVLYAYGGLYSDLDFQCLRPLSPLFEPPRELGLVWEPEEHNKWAPEVGMLYNGFVLARPRHPLIKAYLHYMQRNFKQGRGPLNNTGPVAFAHFIRELGWDKKSDIFLDTCLILPVVDTGKRAASCAENTESPYVITRWREGSGWGKETLGSSQEGEGESGTGIQFGGTANWPLLIFLIFIVVLIFVVIPRFLF